ncbi:MAG: LAGLIDADG family homing endonuclease [Gammaproteobacteria bacterium]|nr:LAGLIDADG family homing endonuclease [Gammaproteobacteria bacterium]
MTHYRTVNPLSLIDASYIAGLIDGEGTITLTRKHRGENRQLAVSISSTERPLLQYVLDITGVGKITGKHVRYSHHAPGFTYAVYNRQALTLLEQIAPYLKSYKSRRSDLVLQEYLALTPRNGKYSPGLRLKRTAFENRLLAIKPHEKSFR